MSLENNEIHDFDSAKLFEFLFRYRRFLSIVTVSAAVLAIIFSSSWFIAPKYKSTVIMYPASTTSISRALLSETPSKETSVLSYGEDAETEQMLQLLTSSRIRDRVIEKFDLMNHYNIKSTGKFRLTKLYNEYKDNIVFARTEYMAVKISVYDTDAQLAADIANDVSDLLDSVKNNIAKERALKAYSIVKKEYFDFLGYIEKMEDSLRALRELGVHDYESQAEMFNQQLAKEIAGNNSVGVRRLEKKLDVLAKYGGAYVGLSQQLEFEREKLSLLRRKYKESEVDAFESLPYKFVVDRAYKSEKKAYPIRWLIVVVSMLSSFLLSVIVLILIENFRRVREKFRHNR